MPEQKTSGQPMDRYAGGPGYAGGQGGNPSPGNDPLATPLTGEKHPTSPATYGADEAGGEGQTSMQNQTKGDQGHQPARFDGQQSMQDTSGPHR